MFVTHKIGRCMDTVSLRRPIETIRMTVNSHSIFQFGETRPEFQIPVLNERAVRASAGIMFFWAIVGFMHALLKGNFEPIRVFIVVFLIEIGIRIFISPRFAPIYIIGQWVVRKQQAEWCGAPQKRFAWGIGFVLAVGMLYLMVINRVVGPINMLVCSICLLLMFFESAFGICIGCKIYNLFNKEKAKLCPGGVCEVPADAANAVSLVQMVIVVVFIAVLFGVVQWVKHTAQEEGFAPMDHTMDYGSPMQSNPAQSPAEAERCKVPAFAKAMGHEAQWKQHNHCQ